MILILVNDIAAIQTEIIGILADAAGIGRIGLPGPENGSAIAFSGGKIYKRYMDGSLLYETELRVTVKDQDQFSASCRAFEICGKLDGIGSLTLSSGRILPVSVSAISMPRLESADEKNICVYSCRFSVKYFLDRQDRDENYRKEVTRK